jgi:hypothetical protein
MQPLSGVPLAVFFLRGLSGTWDVINVTGAPTHAPTIAPTTVEPTEQPQAVRSWPNRCIPGQLNRCPRQSAACLSTLQMTPAPSYKRNVVPWTQPDWNRTESISRKSEEQVWYLPTDRSSIKPYAAPPLPGVCNVQRGKLWTWGCNQRGQLGLADGLYLRNIDYPNENTVSLACSTPLIVPTWCSDGLTMVCFTFSRTLWSRTPSTWPYSRARSHCSCHASSRFPADIRAAGICVFALAGPNGCFRAQVAAGGYHSCAIDVDHNVWCWGWNFFGQARASWLSTVLLAAPF